VLLAAPSRAEERVLTLDPARTAVRITLAATLHTVEGSARLLAGEIRFPPEGGAARGTVRVDARSFATGIARRDRTMHAEVLESERFPEIVFRPDRLSVTRVDGSRGDVGLEGEIDIHGTTRRLVIPASVEVDGRAVRLRARFAIPYVAWGMKDVSNVLLRVAPEVQVEIDGAGSLDSSVEG
jgi:polyisoprenoid-binding protein YceI